MAFSNHEARLAWQRNYEAKKRASNPDFIRTQELARWHRRKNKANESRREKKFLLNSLRDAIMREPSMKNFIGAFGVSVVEEQWLKSPLFIVEVPGRRVYRETLNDPMPTWSIRISDSRPGSNICFISYQLEGRRATINEFWT